jgi:hypothetical protein
VALTKAKRLPLLHHEDQLTLPWWLATSMPATVAAADWIGVVPAVADTFGLCQPM